MNELGLYQEVNEIEGEAFAVAKALNELCDFIQCHPVDDPTTLWVLRKATDDFLCLHTRLRSLSNGPPTTDP